MYVFKGLTTPTDLVHAQNLAVAPTVNNPTVPGGAFQVPPTSVPVMPPDVTPPGYISIFGRLVSYQQLAIGLAVLVGGFFLWKHYKTPAKTA